MNDANNTPNTMSQTGNQVATHTNTEITGANASANKVVTAIRGLPAILARIQEAVKSILVERDKAIKTIHLERDNSVTTIRAERDAAVAAIRAATPPSNNSAVEESNGRNIGGGRMQRTY